MNGGVHANGSKQFGVIFCFQCTHKYVKNIANFARSLLPACYIVASPYHL